MKPIHAVILDDHITPYRLPLFERLAAENLRVTVLFCSWRLPDREWDLPQALGFEHEILPAWVWYVPWRLFRRGGRTIIFNFNLFWRLITLRPDVVVGYAFSIPAWTAFLYACLFRIPYISWSTDTIHTESNLDAFQRWSRQIIINQATLCITPSLQGVEKFRRFRVPEDRIRVAAQTAPGTFGEAVDLARKAGDTYKRQHHISGKIILYIGFVTHSKGLDDLFAAFKVVAQADPEVNLLLVGSGALADSISVEAQALGLADRVHVAGFIQPALLPQVYAGVDLFAFPTRADTFGVVVAEAIISGLPVVCSKHAGTAGMLVEDGRNGYIVDAQEHDELAQAILSILSDDALRARMGQASLEIAQAWNIDDAAANYRRALLDAHRLQHR